MNLAKLELLAGNEDALGVVLERLSSAYPQDPEVFLLAQGMYMQLGETEKADQLLESGFGRRGGVCGCRYLRIGRRGVPVCPRATTVP